jgi:hypothetical protein
MAIAKTVNELHPQMLEGLCLTVVIVLLHIRISSVFNEKNDPTSLNASLCILNATSECKSLAQSQGLPLGSGRPQILKLHFYKALIEMLP